MQISLTAEFLFTIIVEIVGLSVFVGVYISTVQFLKEKIAEMKKDTKEEFENLKKEHQRQIDDLKQDTKEQLEEHSKINDIKVENLREEVKKHNNVLERLALCENTVNVLHDRLDDIEGGR